MLPTFVIGLREGLEAALIVGIIAAFLRKQGRRDLLRWVLAGVGVALTLCVLAGVALKIYSQDLPQRQQEGLETIIGALAVGMVSYMVIWMRRNSRNLKGQLEGLAAQALSGAGGAGRALVLMAFLAVIREGVETVVFVLAAFNEAGSGTTAGIGLLLGIALAIALGYGIYRGGVRINLSKFFRATGLVLVLVAAGIVVNALHTAHEAGWLTVGQSSPLDLTWLVQPGSVQASLLTGMLGIQPHPALIEILGWLLYLVPVGLYVVWPPGRSAPARALARGGAAFGALAVLAGVLLVVLAPDRPPVRPTTTGGGLSAQVLTRAGDTVVVRASSVDPVRKAIGATASRTLHSVGAARHADADTDVYRTSLRTDAASGRPATMSLGDVARLNGGRLPLGLRAPGDATVRADYTGTTAFTVWLDAHSARVLDASWVETVRMTVRTDAGTFAIDRPIATASSRLPAATVHAAVGAAQNDRQTGDRRDAMRASGIWCLVLAGAALALAATFELISRRRVLQPTVTTAEPRATLIRS